MIQIKHRFTGKIIFEAKVKTIEECVLKAHEQGVSLENAELRNTELENADLTCANLENANLTCVSLENANLRNANLRNADLTCAELRGIKNYSENHDIFFELIKRNKVKIFSKTQWECIRQITIHRLCWHSIKKRFGKTAMGVFKKISKMGFDEYEKRYEEILKD
jgi:hypothetical protein